MRADDPVAAGALRLEHVTVVDTNSGSGAPDMTVTIESGVITDVAPTPTVGVRRDASSVDATGKYLVPGFNDMHVHALQRPDARGALALMLANGITGIRQMAGSADLLDRRRRGALEMGPDGPELLAMPGSILTAMNAGTPEAAARTVAEQRAAGADFIKLILVPPAALFGALSAATGAGMLVAGHLQDGADPIAQSHAGFRCIEHLGTGESIWTACSSQEAALAEEMARRPPPVRPFGEGVDPAVLAKFPINPLARTRAADATLRRRALDTFSQEKALALANALRADGTWQVPTLVRLRAMEMADLPDYAEDPNLRYVPAATAADWREVTAIFERLPPETHATFRRQHERELELTRIYDESETLMMAGTDEGGGWIVPGFSLHEEFDALASAGLSALKILQMTTSLPARFLGREDSMGSVAPGYRADLVLLDGDPIAAVRNLHRIHAVVRGGRLYTRTDLDSLLARVEAGGGILA